MTAPGLPHLLRQARSHRSWRTVSLYKPNTGSAARQFVATWHHKRLDPAEPVLELRTTTQGQDTAVQARPVSKQP